MATPAKVQKKETEKKEQGILKKFPGVWRNKNIQSASSFLQISASPMSAVNAWHMDIFPVTRNHYIRILVKEILPFIDSIRISILELEKQTGNLILYAKKIECDIYRQAQSYSEYSRLLNSKTAHIQKQLQEKSNKNTKTASQERIYGTPYIRGRSVQIILKIITEIFKSSTRKEPEVRPARRMQNLTAYAVKVESDIYNQAKTNSEYTHLLLTKIRKERNNLDQTEEDQLLKPPKSTTKERVTLTNASSHGERNLHSCLPKSTFINTEIYTHAVSEIKTINHCAKGILKKDVEDMTGYHCPNKESIKEENVKEDDGNNTITSKDTNCVTMTPSMTKNGRYIERPCSTEQSTEENKYDSRFTKENLYEACSPILRKLYVQPEAIPFRCSNNLLQLAEKSEAIRDYFKIIKKPMDITTIHNNLEIGGYKEPLEFVHDVWTMLINAWTYYEKTSLVYNYCTNLAKLFDNEVDPMLEKFAVCGRGKQLKLMQRVAALKRRRRDNIILPLKSKLLHLKEE